MIPKFRTQVLCFVVLSIMMFLTLFSLPHVPHVGYMEDVFWQPKPKDYRTALAKITKAKFPIQHDEQINARASRMCYDCFWHTFKTTTHFLPDNTTFVFTGDIDDLWLRDSAAQVHPYLPMTAENATLFRLVSGLITRSAEYVLYDPYANAFRVDTSYQFSAWQNEIGRHGLISTWNYELDSGCYFIRLVYSFWRATPESLEFIQSETVHKAVARMVELWTVEQDHEKDAQLPGYKNLGNGKTLFRYPGLARDGKGTQVARTGMTWSGFRPSDDPCVFGYLIPANLFAVSVLEYVEELAQVVWGDEELAQKAKILGKEIEDGINTYGIVEHPTYGPIYAYEVDGLGQHLLMDDANVPSLMSIPYLINRYNETVYQNTRRFILSPDNPTFSRGKNGTLIGYGSPHTETFIPKGIWPMSQIMQGLTTDNVTEKLDILQQLMASDAGTGFMHEAYHPEYPEVYTRPWFCWADALFAEFVQSITLESCSLRKGNSTWQDPPPLAVYKD